MPSRKSADPKKRTASNSATNKTRLEPLGEVQVVRKDLPPVPGDDKRIHPRRPMPLVPERQDNNTEDRHKQSPPRNPNFKT
jgi:hypothetical protein